MGILEGRGDESPRTVAPTDGWVEDTGKEKRGATDGKPKEDERMREG